MSGRLVLRKAERKQAKLRALMFARSGAGKTYTAILVGLHLAHILGTRLCFIDSESGGADKYADIVPGWDFDVIELNGRKNGFHPRLYMEAMDMAVHAEAGVVVVDSASHAWNGKGGILQRVEEEKRTGRNRDQQAAWIKPTEEWEEFIQALVGIPAHLIVCARAKTEWGDAWDEAAGKQKRTAVGTAPILRGEFEYEFDFFGDIERDRHALVWDKNRSNGAVRDFYERPGEDLARDFAGWLQAGGADIEMRIREVAARRAPGVGKLEYADALIAAGVKSKEDLLDDAVFEKARRLVMALKPAAVAPAIETGGVSAPDESPAAVGVAAAGEGEVAPGTGSGPAPAPTEQAPVGEPAPAPEGEEGGRVGQSPSDATPEEPKRPARRRVAKADEA